MKPAANPPEGSETYRLDWAQLRRDWPAWAVLLTGFVAAALAYPHLPEEVPIHFDIHGRPDGYTGRFAGAFVLPLLNLALYVLMLVTPLADPQRANYVRFSGFYRGLRHLMVLLLAALQGVILLVALGRSVDVGLVTQAAVSLLLLYIGNSLEQVRHNYFIGIRTPWTLASERVWQRTHRLGGRLLVVASLLPWLAMPFSRAAAFGLLVAGVLAAVVGSAAYSLVLFRRESSG